MMTTDTTPRTDTCPHCGGLNNIPQGVKTPLDIAVDRFQKAEAEVERLRTGISGIETTLRVAYTEHHALWAELERIKKEIQ